MYQDVENLNLFARGARLNTAASLLPFPLSHQLLLGSRSIWYAASNLYASIPFWGGGEAPRQSPRCLAVQRVSFPLIPISDRVLPWFTGCASCFRRYKVRQTYVDSLPSLAVLVLSLVARTPRCYVTAARPLVYSHCGTSRHGLERQEYAEDESPPAILVVARGRIWSL